MSKQKFYLTTPIYYVNARPHIGHAYTTIAADVIARRHRLLGDDTFLLTGTDEHGQKVERSAAAAGVSPQQFVDQISGSFRALWDRMGITYDDFIRTTEPRHTQAVQKLFQLLVDHDAIYLSTYTGQYSVGEEMFVDGPPGTIGPDGKPTETVTEENYFFRLSNYQEKLIELIESEDPDNRLDIQPEVRRNEVLSFLRGNLNAVVKEIYDRAMWADLENLPPNHPGPGLPPEPLKIAEREGKVKKSASGYYIPGALKDLSISRTSFKWGIPVPGNEKHVIYVWLDALANYMTAIGYGSDDPIEQEKVKKYWPADLHLVGKEIIRFHCVYWPAFLLALRPADVDEKEWIAGMLPKAITAHGWLLFEDSKMSKSRGNIVRTETILDAFGTLKPKPTDGPGAVLSDEYWKHEQDLFASDVLRYFLLREIPFGQDGSFSFDALVQRYNSDLANGYGNLVSRTLTLILKTSAGQIEDCLEANSLVFHMPEKKETHNHPANDELLGASEGQMLGWQMGRVIESAGKKFEQNSFSEALTTIAAAIARVDQFLTSRKPWAATETELSQEGRRSTLYTAAESIRIITALLYPFLPYATAKVWTQLGLGNIEEAAKNGELNNLEWGGLKTGTRLGELGPIFPRAPKEIIQLMTDMENPATPPTPSKFVDEKTTHTAAAPIDSTDPGAAPRTSALAEENPGATVGGSHAVTRERASTPSHTESPASGAFATSSAGSATPDTAQIAIDDFVKIDLRVAQITVAERIPKADKLLRLEVDLGYEKRQILSGIAEWYTPEELIGRRIVVIANLAPRKMRGLESHGMLLAASAGEDGKPVLATFGEEIALGSRLK
jgi:methionyl-tRNA synthetase